MHGNPLTRNEEDRHDNDPRHDNHRNYNAHNRHHDRGRDYCGNPRHEFNFTNNTHNNSNHPRVGDRYGDRGSGKYKDFVPDKDRDGPLPDADGNIDPEQPLPWGGDKPVYEWHHEYTEASAPSNPKMEEELFGPENRIQTGVHFDKRNRTSQVRLKGGPANHEPITDFRQVDLHPTIIDNVMRMQYSKPTPIQRNAIPLIQGGYDLLACAQTGSGKTAAYLLPILSKVLVQVTQYPPAPRKPGARRTKAAPLALIILPTRELAIQIFDETRRFTYMSRIRPVVIYGGADLARQKEQLGRGCDVLVATPGRLVDTLERGVVTLAKVRYLVLDEADRILDLGFEPSIRHILLSPDFVRTPLNGQDDHEDRPQEDRGEFFKSDSGFDGHTNTGRGDENGIGSGLSTQGGSGPGSGQLQTLMISATFPTPIQLLARDFLKDEYCRLRIGRIGGTTDAIIQRVILVEDYEKEETLIELLNSYPPCRTLVFVSTKRKADYLDHILFERQFPCISLHGDRTQREREKALEAFRNGKSPIMIATAVAARGLDIKDILHVINYDLCQDIDDYVHRIGRTARAGHPGLATCFFNHARDWEIAPPLTKLLQECGQEVPDFLQEYLTEESSYEIDFVDLESVSIQDHNKDDEDVAVSAVSENGNRILPGPQGQHT
ncbi:DEAD-box ATP-dependent RNA helicase [Gryganskiella cystojenkinii]|nr:DEAD-box ATP-dependent RNA helicase [Gryganskiella cystojenkinii]